jgi:hypothetical protein
LLDVILKPRRRLAVADFTAQLYLVVVDLASSMEASERQTVYYGQQRAKMPVIRRQRVDGILVYDRRSGGEPLLTGSFNNNKTFLVYLEDTVILENMVWP